MSDEFLQKLEQLKLIGFYAISFYYGEGIGADDLGVPVLERSVKLFGTPIGCLGETRVCYSGNVKSLLAFDFKKPPTVLSNTDATDRYERISVGGWFLWGTDQGVEAIVKRFKEIK